MLKFLNGSKFRRNIILETLSNLPDMVALRLCSVAGKFEEKKMERKNIGKESKENIEIFFLFGFL